MARAVQVSLNSRHTPSLQWRETARLPHRRPCASTSTIYRLLGEFHVITTLLRHLIIFSIFIIFLLISTSTEPRISSCDFMSASLISCTDSRPVLFRSPVRFVLVVWLCHLCHI